MILYNIRAKGTYEYDKFILNIFQICNDTSSLQDLYKNSELLSYINSIKEEYNKVTGENGNSVTLYKYKLATVE